MTLTVFNWVELVGHLPLYGIMAVLLVWTPAEAEQRLWAPGVLGCDVEERDEDAWLIPARGAGAGARLRAGSAGGVAEHLLGGG